MGLQRLGWPGVQAAMIPHPLHPYKSSWRCALCRS